jgi:hypothetical protein
VGTFLYDPLFLLDFYRNSKVLRGFSICNLIMNNDEVFISLCLLPTLKHVKLLLSVAKYVYVPYGSKNKELLFACAVLTESSLL